LLHVWVTEQDDVETAQHMAARLRCHGANVSEVLSAGVTHVILDDAATVRDLQNVRAALRKHRVDCTTARCFKSDDNSTHSRISSAGIDSLENVPILINFQWARACLTSGSVIEPRTFFV
jgi:hypothetical protein